jgi:dTDP-4-dehydrorhamnose 3,5-epimerase/reductase
VSVTENLPTETGIPGLRVIDIPVHGDARGWFKENWQQEKMVAAGLPDFGPVQHNVSFNHEVGVTRGVHAEPWDKLVSVVTGRVFGAWVDLRAGDSFGRVFTCEVGPDRTVFVPRGVGNAYQTLEPGTSYSYLVNEHWSPAARSEYTYLNLADETVKIPWPLPLASATLSEADQEHPRLADVKPFEPKRVLILGGEGQVGRALAEVLPNAHPVGRSEIDLTELDGWDWRPYDVVVNAAAYTAVDQAESAEGRRAAWAVNAAAVRRLAELAREHRFTLVHISSDYVFDGSEPEYDEHAPLAPLGVYGQSKAAGDLAASTAPRHYVVRTSWVVGDGGNFVRTMAGLADRGVSPAVVNDQRGRLTFTDTIAEAVAHLLRSSAQFGVYNVSNDGPVTTWYDVAREVFRLRGRDPMGITPVTTAEYQTGRPMAPRPLNSVLNLSKIKSVGYTPPDTAPLLAQYVTELEPDPT